MTVRLTSYAASELHIRQLKSSSIGGPAGSTHIPHLALSGAAVHNWMPYKAQPSVLTGVPASRVAERHALHQQQPLQAIALMLHAHLASTRLGCLSWLAGKLATLRGTVTRMSHVRPLIVDMVFTCNKCGASIQTPLPEGRFTPPTRCTGAPELQLHW